MPENEIENINQNHQNLQQNEEPRENALVEFDQADLILAKMLELSESDILHEEFEGKYLRENEDGSHSYVGDEALFHQKEDENVDINWNAPRIDHVENDPRLVNQERNGRFIEDDRNNVHALVNGEYGQNVQNRPETPLVVKNVEWQKIENLAGYMGGGRNRTGRVYGGRNGGERDMMGESVRTLGRAIFGSMDCFKDMERECRAKGVDPISQINVIAYNSYTQGPHSMNEVRSVMNWIQQNGNIMETKSIELPGIIADYRPDLMLSLTADSAFLLVQDCIRQGGIEVKGVYVYSWKLAPGYIYKEDGFRDMQNNTLLAGHRENNRNPQIRQERNIRIDQPRQNQDAVRNIVAKEKKESIQSLPSSVNGVKLLRTQGFKTKATIDGPMLFKELDNDCSVEVTGFNKALTLAEKFYVSFKQGDTEMNNAILKAEDVSEWVENQNSFGMKM